MGVASDQEMQVRCLVSPAGLREQYRQFRREGWFIKDPCGLFSAVFTHVLLIFGVITILDRIAIPMYQDHYVAQAFVLIVIFLSLYILAATSHLRCMLTNPGTVRSYTLSFIWFYCLLLSFACFYIHLAASRRQTTYINLHVFGVA